MDEDEQDPEPDPAEEERAKQVMITEIMTALANSERYQRG